MSDHCCASEHAPVDPRYRRVLWVALASNAAMFLVGLAAGMRSVWLCTRNDVLGNLAVVIAASGVFLAESRWPDIAVVAIMASLALSGAFQITQQALAERRARA